MVGRSQVWHLVFVKDVYSLLIHGLIYVKLLDNTYKLNLYTEALYTD